MFWTPENLEHAAAMRWCRRLWAPCTKEEQWSLECTMYRLRGRGMRGRDIAHHITEVLEALRPWRMSDAKLARALVRSFALRAKRGASTPARGGRSTNGLP